MSSLELPRIIPTASGASAFSSAGDSSSYENHERDDGDSHNETYDTSHNVRRQKSNDPARDLSIQVLEKFSLVTRFARETTSQLFRESQSNGFGAVERKNYSHSSLDIPPKIPKDPEEVPIQSTVPSDPLEVTSCALWKLYNLVLQGNYLDI